MKLKSAISALGFLFIIGDAHATDLTLWYSSPGTVSMTQGILLGNGRLGMVMPGNVTSESIVLNEDSLWSGNTNASGAYAEGTAGAFGSYQTFGNLLINLPGQTGYTSYTRTLDLNNGVATVIYTNGNVGYTRTLFCSATDQVAVVQLTASAPSAYTGSIQLVDGHSNTVSSVAGGLMFSGSLVNGELYEAQMQVTNSGGTLVNSGGSINFTNCNSLTLIVALGTSYSTNWASNFVGPNPHTNLVAQAVAAMAQPFATLENRHTNDFSALFNRVSIYLGPGPASATNLPTDQRITANAAAGDDDPGMDALMFAYGRYMMISSSRNALPMNLQGLWNDNNNPDWSSDYHSDLNVEMMYSAEETANLPECFLPFVNWLQSQIPEWRYFTTNASTGINNGGYGYGYGGTNGWATRCSENVWGGQGWEWVEGVNAWYCMYVWDHYQFTGDTNYLLNDAYPMMKEVCQYWQQHLLALPYATNGAPAGTLVVTNGWSPETGPREEGVTCDQEFIWDVFSNYQQAASILNTDAVYAATIAGLQTNLLQPRVGPWGELREWFFTADVQGPNAGSSEMEFCGLYPGHQFTPEVSPSLAAAARVHLLSLGADGGYEWAYAQHMARFARLHDWWSAFQALAGQYTVTEPNLSGFNQVAQMDSCMGVTAGITEMLLQSQSGFINLLPALPAAWPAGYVTGLRARGGYTVGIMWTNAAATAAITPDFTGTCTVHTPNPVMITSNGVAVTVTTNAAGNIQWAVAAGSTYMLQWVLPPFPAQMPVPADYSTEVNIGTSLTWRAGGTNYQHNLYFGTGSNAVATANTSSLQFQGLVTGTNNFNLPLLLTNATYYWRVDEISGTNIGTGVVWQFTTSASFAATNPSPAVAQTRVPFLPIMSWTPGVSPNTNCLHDVYLGTSSFAVAAATTNSALYQGRYPVPSFTPGVALQSNTIYYWRVDEIASNAVSPGAVWNFTTAADALHNSLFFYYTFDTSDILNGTNLFDRSGTPPHEGSLYPATNLPAFGVGQVNQAVVLNGTSQYAASPAPLIGTSNATFLCWIDRNGSQSSYAGIMFCRGTTTVAGLDFNSGNNTLGYHWDNESGTYTYNSGLTPPTNQWALAALVVTPTNAIFYLGETNGTLATATHTYTHVLQAFDGQVCIGQDSNGGRLFNGAMDEAYFWTRSLSPSEIGQIFTNGLNGIGLAMPPAPSAPLDTWTGGGADNNWSTGGNWGGTAPDATGDNLLFTGSAGPNNTNNWVSSVGWVRLNPSMAFTNNGAALTINSGLTNSARKNVWNIPLTLGANQNIDTVAGTSLALNGLITGGYALNFTDTGTVTLSAANTYAGGTTANGGTLVETVAASGGTGALTVNAGAKISYRVGIYAQADFSALNLIGGVFSVDAPSENQVNYVNRPVLMQGGILTSTNGLGGPANDGGYGNFLLNGGVMTVSGTSQSLINSTTFATANGASFNVGVTGAGIDLLVASVINGGNIVKNGPGTMALTGANTYAGATTVSNGTLLVNGSISTSAVTVNSGGTLAGTGSIGGAVTVNGGATVRVNPAATGVGKLTFASSLTFNSGATNVSCVSRNGGVATNDLLQVSGAVTFAGTLVVTNIGTHALALGDSFKLFKAGTYAGNLTNFILPSLTNGLSWNTSTLATNGTLAVVVSSYKLTYLAGANGTISGTSPLTVNYGASGSAITAVANSGYLFANWSDGSVANPRTDSKVTNNITVTASFAVLTPPMVTNLSMVVGGMAFTLTGAGMANQNYVLLTATNLPPLAWTPVLTNMAGSNGVFSFTDLQVTNYPQRFYCVQPQH